MNTATIKQNKRNEKHPHRVFTRTEEIIHALTHAAGAVLGAVGLALMIAKASDTASLLSAIVFGVSLILLYAASGTFHASCAIFGLDKPSKIRTVTEKCDHSLIFLLILGTYTPACLSAMAGPVGYILFALVGSACALGFILNVINVARFIKISMVLYVISGWAIAAAVYPYYLAVGAGGVGLLLAGGVSYTAGLIFYNARHIKYMHVIWHALVLLGSVLHFLMVYFYCL